MAGFRSMIWNQEVQVLTQILWLMVGNCQIPISEHISPVGQMQKLINTIIKSYPLSIQKIVVSWVLPCPDWEVELENEVKKMNQGIVQAIQELKQYHHVGNHVMYDATQ